MRLAVACVLLLLMAAPAKAQVVRAQTGEHGDFTRIALILPSPSDWSLSRSPSGYQFRVSAGPLRYDLSAVFRTITRNRLAAIWADPVSSVLNLGVACACHAIPFELRPGIVVIDIRDGPPQPGSSFELDPSGTLLPPLERREEIRPRRRAPGQVVPPSDPVVLPSLAAGPIAPLPSVPWPASPPDVPGLPDLRNDMISELARAASSGVIELAPALRLPVRNGSVDALPAIGPQAHLDLPGVRSSIGTDGGPDLGVDGDSCWPDTRFDVAAWSDGRPYPEQLASLRASLVGEFDRPDPEIVDRLVQLDLHFGFGAEARASLDALPAQSKDADLWRIMAAILDGERPAAAGALLSQQSCDGPGALWAVLAGADADPRTTDLAAIQRHFSALPAHLRQLLGPLLVDRLLAAGQRAAALTVQDATNRAGGPMPPAARLAGARLERAVGQASTAERTARGILRDGGPAATEALVELVEATFVQRGRLDGGTIDAISAFRVENTGGPLSPALNRAEALAYALDGQFERAFALPAAQDRGTATDLWALLSEAGGDAALLALAVIPPDQVPKSLSDPIRVRISTRLIDLGFPDQAIAWLPPDDRPEYRRLLARAELARGDARRALRNLAGLNAPEDQLLRAETLERLGADAAAAETYAELGRNDLVATLNWRRQNWQAARAGAPENRLAALEQLASGSEPAFVAGSATPLAQARGLLDGSAATRQTIADLLASVPAPDGSEY